MKIDVFGKKRTTKDGKKFYIYSTKLKKKDGTEVYTQVKFREECGNPKKVPCTIEFDKKNANYSEHNEIYADAEGNIVNNIRRELWISNYTESDYIDTSMDDFE